MPRRRPQRRFANPRPPTAGLPLLGREAVEQASPAGAHEVLLAAAARRVREVPEVDALRVPDQVVVAHHGSAFATRSPVAAGHVLAGRKGGAVPLRPGQDVVLVRLIAGRGGPNTAQGGAKPSASPRSFAARFWCPDQGHARRPSRQGLLIIRQLTSRWLAEPAAFQICSEVSNPIRAISERVYYHRFA